MIKGKLIVIEGLDGAGKATQTKLLRDYFKTHKIPYKSFSFPQYYKTFFGRWIGRFLRGDFGKVEELPPYLLMFPYAADRWQAKREIKKALKKGMLVISDRYTGSNAYQAAKLPKTEQNRFIKWSSELEYKAFGVPQEDLNIFLHLPVKLSQELLKQKSPRAYMGNHKKNDIHESNIKLLQEVEKIYLSYCDKYPHWQKIDCAESGKILTKEKIQQKIIKILKTKKII